MPESEVAHLRARVALEYEAMVQGLSGLAEGMATHTFITARMARIEEYHEELTKEVGESVATQIICELYNKAVR